jgi:hypothetical protein
VNRRDRHVDGQLDRVVCPRDPLRALHLLRELTQPPLQVVGVAEHAAEGVRFVHCPIVFRGGGVDDVTSMRRRSR